MLNAKCNVRIDEETMRLLKEHKNNTGASMVFTIKAAVAKYIAEYPSKK